MDAPDCFCRDKIVALHKKYLEKAFASVTKDATTVRTESEDQFLTDIPHITSPHISFGRHQLKNISEDEKCLLDHFGALNSLECAGDKLFH
ncbi:unnamed protein product [Heterobilharzia americana]|nr:unnamed protein product [Heterobilharzia americana]